MKLKEIIEVMEAPVKWEYRKSFSHMFRLDIRTLKYEVYRKKYKCWADGCIQTNENRARIYNLPVITEEEAFLEMI